MDKKDALTIVRFLLVHGDTVSHFSPSQDLQDMRDIALERESLCNMISAFNVEMKRLLRNTFPELENLCDITTMVMLDFIEDFPSARLVRAAKPKAIQQALNRKGVGTRLTCTAEDIIKAARNSIAPVSPAKELILKGKGATLRHLQQRLDELTRARTQYCKSTLLENLEIVNSIEGCGLTQWLH